MTTPNTQDTAKAHAFSDVDSAPTAQHHTIGPGPTQVASGQHIHDGRGTRKLFTPLSVTGSRGGNAALASLLTQLASQGLIVDNTVA